MAARFLASIGFFCLFQGNLASGQENPLEVADAMYYTRIYSDSTEQSHFSTELKLFSLVEFSPLLPPVSVSESIDTSDIVIISAPAQGVADWHPVPRRQINIILTGEVEIEVSDGEKRRFGPGSLILGEDTEGVGHITRVISDVDAYFAVISLVDKNAGYK